MGNDSSKHTAPLAGNADVFDDQGHATALLGQVSRSIKATAKKQLDSWVTLLFSEPLDYDWQHSLQEKQPAYRYNLLKI